MKNLNSLELNVAQEEKCFFFRWIFHKYGLSLLFDCLNKNKKEEEEEIL